MLVERNVFSSRLELIWLISRLKISKISTKCLFGKKLQGQKVNPMKYYKILTQTMVILWMQVQICKDVHYSWYLRLLSEMHWALKVREILKNLNVTSSINEIFASKYNFYVFSLWPWFRMFRENWVFGGAGVLEMTLGLENFLHHVLLLLLQGWRKQICLLEFFSWPVPLLGAQRERNNP